MLWHSPLKRLPVPDQELLRTISAGTPVHARLACWDAKGCPAGAKEWIERAVNLKVPYMCGCNRVWNARESPLTLVTVHRRMLLYRVAPVEQRYWLQVLDFFTSLNCFVEPTRWMHCVRLVRGRALQQAEAQCSILCKGLSIAVQF